MKDEEEITIKDEAEADAMMAAEWGAMAGTPDYLKYQALVKANFRKNIMLAKKGVQMNDLSLLHSRIELLIEFAFEKGGKDRLDLEMRWQETMRDAMEKMHNEIMQKERAEGLVVPKPKLFVPGQ